MKVGIVTLQLHKNYGGVLQNFALQKVLKKMGHDPITIDKIPNRNNLRYYISHIKSIVLKVLGRETNGIFYFSHFDRDKRFSHFVDKNIKITRPTTKYTIDIFKKNHCDLMVVGSDQVWRRNFFTKEDIKNYFGAFLQDSNIPRVAYAASFGVSDWEYEKDLAKDCKILANQFIGISTREDSGIKLCQKLGFENAVGVLDPTLLLTANDYRSVCKEIPQRNPNLLMAYILDYSEDKRLLIEQIAVEKNLKYIIIKSEYQAEISVEEWLSLFRDAEYIVTDSFHGTAFSVIFNKSFNCIVNSGRGADRFYSLLNRLGLKDRIIKAGESTNVNPIDWSNVNTSLDSWRVKSMTFLEESLNKAMNKFN